MSERWQIKQGSVSYFPPHGACANFQLLTSNRCRRHHSRLTTNITTPITTTMTTTITTAALKLAALVNEAAIRAVRKSSSIITAEDFAEAAQVIWISGCEGGHG